jgi:trans-aconitate methyltransferase
MSDISQKWNSTLYNNKHAFVYQYGEDLIKILEPKKDERILDLGCGSGQLTAKIAELAKKVVGIDKSPEMIVDAEAKFPKIEFHVADAATFSFSEKFDAIFSNAALHWVTDYENAIRCMYENLKEKGRIVLEFGGKGNVQTIVDQLRISLKKRGYDKQSELQLWYFPSIGEYATHLEKAGFRVVMAQHYERPTELADENSGITDWLSMFAESFFENVSVKHKTEIKQEVQEKVRSKCLKNGKWFADYKRIRIVALKE